MTDIFIPQPMSTLQVVAVQNLTGRQHPHVRVFGYRPEDPQRVILEVALYPDDAVDLIAAADTNKKFPEIEIETRYVMKILSTAGLDVIHIGEVGDDPTGPPLHPRRGA
jgi:hypothetical protein